MCTGDCGCCRLMCGSFAKSGIVGDNGWIRICRSYPREIVLPLWSVFELSANVADSSKIIETGLVKFHLFMNLFEWRECT